MTLDAVRVFHMRSIVLVVLVALKIEKVPVWLIRPDAFSQAGRWQERRYERSASHNSSDSEVSAATVRSFSKMRDDENPDGGLSSKNVENVADPCFA